MKRENKNKNFFFFFLKDQKYNHTTGRHKSMQAPLDRHLMQKANVSIKTSKMNSNENDRLFSYLKLAEISLKPTNQPFFMSTFPRKGVSFKLKCLISPKVTGELFLI